MSDDRLFPFPSHQRARWRRSSHSAAMNNCVEAARLADSTLAVRDSKDVSRRALRFSAPAWDRFLSAVEREGTG
ncbi:DUF397 domain-containing protein [Streptomyces sp. CAU 1734]|uniref:DUF397 domain-containing protein n=1 Tax=Streptomyces sp. CAU 1734 TaxID=3140360 RepID=UPI00326128A4